tara:strand:+ start:1095 stop:1277 length:183 start_codon:yes stop_codon:yes gene_type:complete
MKTYSLVIVFNEDTDEVEYIEEELTEDTSNALLKLSDNIENYTDSELKRMIENGFIVGES